MTIKVNYCRRGAGGALHADAARPVLVSSLARCVNYSAVDFTGVNNAVVDLENNKIIQAAGYTSGRGMFCDLYT